MPIKLKISKTELANLYLRKKMSSYEIGLHFNCSQTTIRDRLLEYGIKTRSIQEAKSLTKPLYERRNFAGNLADKAYIIGFRLGDLHVSKTHPNSPTIRVNTNSTKIEQLNLFKKLFSPYGHISKIGPDKNGATFIRCYLNSSFRFLLKTKCETLPKWILNSKKYSLSFMAGYIDAEGCFSINHRQSPVFAMNSQDKNIMVFIQSTVLPQIGINTKLRLVRRANSIIGGIRSNRDVFNISIYNQFDLKKLTTAIIPLLRHSKRKRDALKVTNLLYGRT